jgi:uncharacterized protein (TIRG00374 family)
LSRSSEDTRPHIEAAASLAERQEDSAGRGFGHLGRRLLVPVLLGLLVLVGLALVADARELVRHLKAFDLSLLGPILTLSLTNYLLRFVRWEIYLRSLDVRLPLGPSLGIFLVGFVLSITPGKAGELGKAWLARELGGGAARRTVAVVVAERITDLLGMFLLMGLGALTLPNGLWVAAACLGLSVTGIVVLLWSRGFRWLLGHLHRIPRLGSHVDLLIEIYEHLLILLRPSLLGLALLLSSLAWAAEAMGFVIVARSYGAQFSWLTGVFDYAFSSLLGALTMLPGGLVASEGALTALLDLQGLDTAAAASATVIIRAATLWFAVLLGLAALPCVFRLLRARDGSA